MPISVFAFVGWVFFSLGFHFLLGLRVFVAWISGGQHDLWSNRESPSKLEVGSGLGL